MGAGVYSSRGGMHMNSDDNKIEQQDSNHSNAAIQNATTDKNNMPIKSPDTDIQFKRQENHR
jgi:hypothetical protein